MELIDRIAAHAMLRGGAIAIRQVDAPGGDRVCTYAQLHERLSALSRALRNTLPRGSVVMLLCGNRPEFWVNYFAILAADLSVFPVNPDIVLEELRIAAGKCSAAAAVVEGRLTRTASAVFPATSAITEVGEGMQLLLADSPRQPQPGAGLLLQSSGTTGHPRIVWRSARSLDHMARSLCERIGFEPQDRVLTGMPLGHSYGGEHGVLAPAFGGASVHVCSGVQLPIIARELRESGITMLPGVPFLFEIMAQSSEAIPRLSHLRYAISAGAQLPQVVYDAFVQRFGLGIGQIYGATEVGSVTFNDPARIGFDPMSVGLPLDGVDIRILDPAAPRLDESLGHGTEGHIAIKAPTMLSHLVGPGSADQLMDGFLLTGDLGRVDAHGALTITGRLRLLIDVGGRKVNPIEVEQVIRGHPNVAECVVVPIAVSHTVSRLKAVVIARRGTAPRDAEDIRTFAREHLSAYKVPRLVEFRTDLPRTPLGKILRHLVEVQA